MSITALRTAATGMTAMDQKLNVLANNLANIGTVGFKRSRTNFEDLLYEVRKEPGVQNAQGEPNTTGIEVGLGVVLSGTQLNFEQGALDITNQTYDLAIRGDGFFQVTTYEGGQEVTAYTRAGNFTLNANGQLVLANSEGALMQPEITIPDDAVAVQVTQLGEVLVRQQGQPAMTQVGQVELARFINPAGLLQIGRNLYLESDASGTPITGNPAEEGLGTLQQGAVELSNVDPVRELVELIQTQRAFELNSQTVRSGEEALRIVANLRR